MGDGNTWALGRLVRYWLCLPIHSFCCACFGFQLEWRRHTGEPHTPTSYGSTCLTINRIEVLYRLAQKVHIAHRRRPAYMYLSQQATHVPLFQQRSELTSLQNPIRIPNDKEFLCLCAFPARMASIPRVRKGGFSPPPSQPLSLWLAWPLIGSSFSHFVSFLLDPQFSGWFWM